MDARTPDNPPEPDSPIARIEAEGFVLEVGRSAGTIVSGEAKPEAETSAPEPQKGKPQVAEEAVDRASGVTAKVEQADALYKDLADGSIELAQAQASIDSLIGLLGRLDKDGKHEDALRVARTLSKLLTLARRWAALIKALLKAKRAGKVLEQPRDVAWAKHEIGTVRLVTGDLEDADRELGEARRLRERHGTRDELAATNHNLQTLCKRLRRMVREKKLVEQRRWLALAASPLVLAVLALLLTAAGVAGGMALGDRGGNSPEPPNPPTGTTTGPDGPDKKGKENETSYSLDVEFKGDAGGVVKVSPIGLECRASCSAAGVAAGTELTLRATHEDEVTFGGFSGGGCSGSGDTCEVTMSGARSVTASFEPSDQLEYLLAVTIHGEGGVSSDPAGVSCKATSETSARAGDGGTFRQIAEKGEEGTTTEKASPAKESTPQEEEEATTEAEKKKEAEEAATETEKKREAEEAATEREKGEDTGDGNPDNEDGNPDKNSELPTASCGESFPAGSVITLEVEAARGWAPTGFPEPCVELSESRCELTLREETPITLEFEQAANGGVD